MLAQAVNFIKKVARTEKKEGEDVEKPKVTIIHKTVGAGEKERDVTKMLIDDIELHCVTDFFITKSSAKNLTELTVKFDCGELQEMWKD